MILGFTSLFIDQYDVNFSPEGVAKDVHDAVKSFQHSVEPVTTTLKKVSGFMLIVFVGILTNSSTPF